MDLDQHDMAERCSVEVLPGSVLAHHHFMVDRLEDKVRAGSSNAKLCCPGSGRDACKMSSDILRMLILPGVGDARQMQMQLNSCSWLVGGIS